MDICIVKLKKTLKVSFLKYGLLGFLLINILLIESCNKKATICPAYQSSFFLDSATQYAYFSYFETSESDSSMKPKQQMPFPNPTFNQFGIANKLSQKGFKKRFYKIPMVDKMTIDTTKGADSTAVVTTDSTGVVMAK